MSINFEHEGEDLLLDFYHYNTIMFCQFVLQVWRSHVVSELPSLGNPICVHVDSEEWFVGIYGYLKRKKFPDRVDKNTYIRIRKLIGCYLVLSNVLYQRSYNGLLQ